MEQLSLFNKILYWIPEVDNSCRLWRCPVCDKAMVGQPLHWYQFNYYKYCPYCGTPLRTHRKYVSDDKGLPNYELSSLPVLETDLIHFMESSP